MELAVMRSFARKIAPHGSLVFVQMVGASSILLNKVIFVQGTSATVFVMYQFMLSTLVLSTLAFIFERNKRTPPLTMRILLEIFVMAFVGLTFGSIMLSAALYFISSTIASSVLNIIPAITFVISLITKQEKLQIRTLWGNGKLFGTLVSVSGALTLIFWHESTISLTTTDAQNWAIGLAMLIAGVVANSMWIVMMEPMARRFQADLTMTAIMLFFATMQALVVAAALNHKDSQWKINWGFELLNIVVAGPLSTGLSAFIVAWCAGLKGPVFVASFNPLGTLFTTIVDVLFFGYGLNVGSFVGSVLIVVGLYMYLWSKQKEEVQENEAQDIVDPDSEIITSLLIHNKPSSHLATSNNI